MKRLIFFIVVSVAVVCCSKPQSDETDEPGPGFVNLSEDGYANCFVVSKVGAYAFTPTRGNSGEPVGEIASVSVLWESCDNKEIAIPGSLITDLEYVDGQITFMTHNSFTEGNLLIAAKNANGSILWSWHIWITDKISKQVYNNAGDVIPRNLGALSGKVGESGSSGLFYQWGRKDPFLGRLPEKVASSSTTGTVNFVVQNPMTFVTANKSNNDWFYTGSIETDNTRWADSSQAKSMYDPCPVGWRVPDGGKEGLWAKAAGSSLSFSDYPYDKENGGMNFSGKFSSAGNVWYPASGYMSHNDAVLYGVGSYGVYWSASPYGYAAYCFYFNDSGTVVPVDFNSRACAFSVRCVKE